jgi:ABC-type antimicrobial peptide transport system permease subunit
MTINNLKVELRRYNDDDLRNNRYYSAGIIRLSPNNYQKLNLGKTHQISLTVSDNANPEQVVKDINNKGYLSFHAAVDFNDNGLAIIGIIFNIFILGVSVILMIVVYLIAFLALKNVMMSKKKDYLIMRSLGVKSGKIKGIVYTEVISLTLVATIFWIVIIALIKNYTSSRFLVLIREFTVGDMIAIFCIMSILSLLLAFRFGSRIVKETIVTRFLNQ